MERLTIEFKALVSMAKLSREGVLIYSLIDKQVMYANSIAFAILGFSENALPADLSSVLEFVAPEDREYIKAQYSTLTDVPVTPEVEFRLMGPGGDAFLCCNGYLLTGESALVIFIRDITKPKEHENYLVEFGSRKNTALDTLTHQMSGALNLMQNLSLEADKYIGNNTDKNLKIYLELLKDNSKSCLDMINDLLKSEHEVSPTIYVKSVRIDVIKKVALIHHELQRSYRLRRFELHHSDKPVYINTDEVKLLQVVNNLTSNAIKFSPPTEPITIDVTENDKEVVVSVKDQGIGIPGHLQKNVFERQIGAGRTGLHGEKSIGLGLSICKNLMQLLEGKIWFESKEEEGSTFYISLPKNRKEI